MSLDDDSIQGGLEVQPEISHYLSRVERAVGAAEADTRIWDRMDGVKAVKQGGSKVAACRRFRRPRGMAHVRARRLSRGVVNLLVARCRSDAAAAENGEDAIPWSPSHVVTRRAARISREVYSAWKSHVGTSPSISAEKVKKLFNDLQLFPSETDVYEMLECAKECGGRTKPSHLTYNEFCVIASELKKHDELGPNISFQKSRIPKKDGDRPKGLRTMSRGQGKCEVFLGGSCNPTTWRTDVAIPLLQQMGITFYNPQVDYWRPELLELEYQAKEQAGVLFFVIDNQTRCISALIEVAEIAGLRRRLVLVVQSYTQQRQSICGEPISQGEYEDLREGQLVLQRLVERQGIPVFDKIPIALHCTARVLRENKSVEEVGASMLRSPNFSIPRARETFNSLDRERSGWLNVIDACSACETLVGRRVSQADLKRLLPEVTRGNADDSELQRRVNFDQFFALVSEMKLCQEREALGVNGKDGHRDVFLGGSVKDTSWRESVAIPMLKKEQVTWHDPRPLKGDDQLTAAAIDESSVLLFVITDTCRSIAPMAMASHYIGRGRTVVLCVQHLPENAIIGGETLTPLAIKDYNRGRMYLADLASRAGVPVFTQIADAVARAARMSRQRQ